MSAVSLSFAEPLDTTSLQAIMIRWKLAEQHLLDQPEAVETGNLALQVLVGRDLPMLIRELFRLRPELHFWPSPQPERE